MSDYERIFQFLSQPETYASVEPVERKESHISSVFLTQNFVYKLLKPVKFDFLDFSTREARYQECWNEVRLNRRLAPDVYLDVLPIVDVGGALKLGGVGHPLDWVIEMRRLPDEYTLLSRISRGVASRRDIDRILDVLIPFFENAASDPQIRESGRPPCIRRNVLENLAVLADAAEDEEGRKRIALLRSQQLQMLSLHADLFEQRVADGWIRDGHGDLKADHFYLTEPAENFPVEIIDCIAFNDRLRHVDTLDEICFLATDLEVSTRSDLAEYAIREYGKRMNDPLPQALIAFYKSYRLSVRAKVAHLSEQFHPDEITSMVCPPIWKGSDIYAIAATEALRSQHRPFLILIGGTSGTGKSTVAGVLAEQLGAVRHTSDVIRKQLFGLELCERLDDPALYSQDANVQTYGELIRRGRNSLDVGIFTILDATFLRAEDRKAARQIVDELGAPSLFVECVCPVDVAEQRILARAARNNDPSDADVAVLHAQLKASEPLQDDEKSREYLRLETLAPADELAGQIVSRLRVM